MAMDPHPMWYYNADGKWSQINGVIDWVIGTPLVGRGYYRDKPAPIPGAGAVVGGDNGGTLAALAATVVGGVTPTVVTTTVGSNKLLTLSAASTAEEDDDYTHEPLRYVFSPEPYLFVKTSVAGAPPLPTDTTFSTDRPLVPSLADLESGGTFEIITGDCILPWVAGVSRFVNTPPQDWTVFTGE